MSTYNPGRLKDTIDIVAEKVHINDLGIKVSQYTNIHTGLKAEINAINTKEYISSGDKDTAALRYTVICRRRNVTREHFIKYDNRLFNVKHVVKLDDVFDKLTIEEVV